MKYLSQLMRNLLKHFCTNPKGEKLRQVPESKGEMEEKVGPESWFSVNKPPIKIL